MPTVELPAHNVAINEASPSSYAEIVGGGEALATRDPDFYVRFNWDNADYNVFVGKVWNGAGFTSALGFGLWDPASVGVTAADITDIRLIAEGWCDRFCPDVDDAAEADYFANYGANATNTPIERWPFLLVRYEGDAFENGFGTGYNLSQFFESGLDGSGGVWPVECAVQMQHLIAGDDYVIAGIGTPDTGTFGLQPEVQIADPLSLSAFVNRNLYLTYLAIRITYGADAPTYRRIFPRDDGLAGGARRTFPQSKALPSSNRATGYL